MSDFKKRLMEQVLMLGDPDPTIRSDAAWAFSSAASHGTNITVALPALGGLLSDADVLVWRAAERALGSAIDSKKSHAAALPVLVKALSEGNGNARRIASLHMSHFHGAELAAAVPVLANALSDGDMRVRWNSAAALEKASFGGVDITAAMAALVSALFDGNMVVSTHAAKALKDECAIKKCASIETLGAMEANLRKGHDALRKKCQCGKGNELARAGLVFSKLMNKIAKRRNELARAGTDGLLLDDIPKPPQRGVVYREMRRALRYV